MKIVIASGYFNPLHKGHIEYLNKSKSLGDRLYVIVNNDFQIKLKGSKPFQNQDERLIIIESLKCVDSAIISIDVDRSVCDSIREIYENTTADSYIFTNGGDQFSDAIPESAICDELDIYLVDGLGDKIQSSSWLLKNTK